MTTPKASLLAGGLTTAAEGLRALLLRRVRWPRVSASPMLSLALLVLALVLTLALDRLFLLHDSPLMAGEHLALDWLALRLVLGELALTVLVAWLAFRQMPLYFLNVTLSLAVWNLLLSYGLWALLRHRLHGAGLELLIALFSLWYLVALLVMVRRGYGGIRNAWLRSALVLAPLCLWTALSFKVPGPPLWQVIRPVRHVDSIAQEDIFELQRDLLAQKLAALRPQRPDLAEYYFISFAPDGSEAVFRRELDVVQALVDRRLDTEGRSLRLQNSPEGLRQYPVATVGNLRRAIDGVARVMDRDKDVLFLYLTAHGSHTHFLSAELDPMQLVNLNGGLLRGMLDAAGIRNRVIVISACYSGGFIDTLANSDTLIITASDATHPSFGCGNESDFTYFGRAFFEYGLRDTVSLPDSYRLAVPVVRQWEARLNQGFSNPQISLGVGLAETLKELDGRLRERIAKTAAEPPKAP